MQVLNRMFQRDIIPWSYAIFLVLMPTLTGPGIQGFFSDPINLLLEIQLRSFKLTLQLINCFFFDLDLELQTFLIVLSCTLISLDLLKLIV